MLPWRLVFNQSEKEWVIVLWRKWWSRSQGLSVSGDSILRLATVETKVCQLKWIRGCKMKFSDKNKLFALKLTRMQVLYIFLNFYQRKHQQQLNNNVHVKLFYFYVLINMDVSEEFSKLLPKSKVKLRSLEQLKNCKFKKNRLYSQLNHWYVWWLRQLWIFFEVVVFFLLLLLFFFCLKEGSNMRSALWIWDHIVWPFKWKLRRSTFLWCCLLCCTRWF